MRRIYIPLIIAVLLLAFGGGYWMGSRNLTSPTLHAIIKKRDSLTVELEATQKRVELLKQSSALWHSKAMRSDSIAGLLHTNKIAAARKYEARIKALERATAVDLDTALATRYPKPRASYNQSLRPIVVPEWRAREIAQDLVRMDSLSETVAYLDSINAQNQISITARDQELVTKDSLITEKDQAITLILERESGYAQEAVVHKKEARKYKRQRNGVLAGVGVVVVGVAVKFFTSR